jgi:hypothetical protein
MELSAYLGNCFDNAKYPTYYTLSLSFGPVLRALRSLRHVSETAGKEYGFKLTASPTGRLTAGTPIEGSEQNVELKTKEWHLDRTYIGDCHTHPYQLKMGPAAEIGPSSGDYKEWWTYPPTGFRLAVHFVISVDRVFLVVSRIKTVSGLRFTTKPESETLKTYARENLKIAAEAFDDYHRLKTYPEKLRARKQAWDRYAPKAAQEFAAENLAFNLDMARLLRFEFYAGRLGYGTAGCNLQLLSSRLYGSCCEYFTQMVYS